VKVSGLKANKKAEEGVCKMKNIVQKLLKDESGQGTLEYALVIGLVVIGLFVAINTLGEKLQGLVSGVNDVVDDAKENLPSIP
jgi:Flp pilus assembly pilin Flp